MKNISRKLFLTGILFVLFLSNAYAEEQRSTITATADGIATITGNNTAMARDKAINDALRKAVEQAVGTMISSETIVQNFQLLSDRVYSKTQGYVQNYSVVSERQTGNLYQVSLKATVATGILKDDLSALGLLISRKNMPRVMIMVAEQNIGQAYFNYWWSIEAGQADMNMTENTLMERLTEKGFNMVDHSVMSQKAQINQAFRVENINNDAIKAIGNLYDAEVVIYGKALARLAGSVMGTSMKSAEANVSLRAVNTDNGQVIASATSNGSAVHISDISAGNEALRKTTEQLSENLVNQIINRWSKEVSSGTMVQMVISGITSYTSFVKFKDMVQNRVRGVSGIYQRSFGAGVATIDVEIKGSAQTLADELTMLTYQDFTIDITGITQNGIEVQMRSQ